MKSIVVALASFGMSGRIFHAPFLEANPNFHFKLILERTKNESSELYPNTKIVRNFNDILNNDEVELVVINTPLVSVEHVQTTVGQLWLRRFEPKF